MAANNEYDKNAEKWATNKTGVDDDTANAALQKMDNAFLNADAAVRSAAEQMRDQEIEAEKNSFASSGTMAKVKNGDWVLYGFSYISTMVERIQKSLAVQKVQKTQKPDQLPSSFTSAKNETYSVTDEATLGTTHYAVSDKSKTESSGGFWSSLNPLNLVKLIGTKLKDAFVEAIESLTKGLISAQKFIIFYGENAKSPLVFLQNIASIFGILLIGTIVGLSIFVLPFVVMAAPIFLPLIMWILRVLVWTPIVFALTWLIELGTWLLLVATGIFGAPLWALMLLDYRATGLGNRAERGIILMITLFLYPFLMVGSLMIVITLMNGLWFIFTTTFVTIVSSGNMFGNLIAAILCIFSAIFVAEQLIDAASKWLPMIPNGVIELIGGGVRAASGDFGWKNPSLGRKGVPKNNNDPIPNNNTVNPGTST